MRIITKVLTIILVYLLIFSPLNLFAGTELPFDDAEISISMDFQDANMKDILKIFSLQSGLNFIASENIQDRKVTLYLDKVPIKEAMEKIFKANNLAYELDRKANIFIVKDLGPLMVETVTKVFYLKYASVSTSSIKEEMSLLLTSSGSIQGSEGGGSSGSGGSSASGGKWKSEDSSGITVAVKKLISEYGSVIEDYRTNSLIVTDIPSKMAVIETLIASLDLAAPQVILEVEMLDVSKNIVDQIGIKFGQTPFSVAITGATATGALGFPFKDWAKTFFSDSNRGTLAINPNSYQAQLDFLRTQTDTKFLARPRILTLNNEPAEIMISTNESIGVKTTTEASTSTTQAEPERAQTGVILRVTPQINVDIGEITMFIYPQVSEAIQGSTLTSSGQTFQYKDPEIRCTKSVVRVKDGETIVLGGLIRNEVNTVITKLPILGDLPVIGALFRHKGGTSDKNKQRELLVFITPKIIKENNLALAQAQKVNLPEREQKTASEMNREIAIGSTLDKLEKPY